MKHDMNVRKMLKSISSFLVIFLVVAFVITCCFSLFLNVMATEMQITFTNENLRSAARLTFLNVLILSILISVIDAVRRTLTVERSAKRITDAAEKMIQGDFSVRIPISKGWDADDPFSEIARCFNKMAQELGSVETLQTDFIANVSHELKTPLSIIQNYGTLLQTPGLPEDRRNEYARIITAASRRLADLITNILQLSKLENQQIVPQFEPFDLSEQVCECLLGFEDVWEQKGIRIHTDIEDGITVRSDARMMSLVWNNLFSNAIKFTESGGTVSLTIHTDGEDAVVCIADTGCGISKDVGAHMFDKFYQGDTSHATQGNGLGLSLVKRVIDLTGCDIAVESELGKGSAFTVRMRRGSDA